MEFEELIRISQEAEKQRKLTGADDRTLRQINELHREIAQTRKRQTDLLFPEGLQSHIEDLRSVARERVALAFSPTMASIADANIAAINLVDSFKTQQSAIEDVLKLGGFRAEEWLKMVDGLGGGVPVHKYLEEQFAFLAERSMLAQANLVAIDLAARIPNLNVAEELLTTSRLAFEVFSTSYKDLFTSLAEPATSILNLPPRLAEFPTHEFFNGVDLLSTTATREVSDYDEEIVIVREEIHQETYDLVTVHLRRVNPDWINMLEGARQSLRSDNPDRVRHSITSLRELLREIMHYLSPEDELRAWSDTPEHFSNNRPTRKARLQFIAREINHGRFSDFVRKDIDSMIEMINLFQAGTHAANSSLTEEQVAALLARVEGAILFLFAIANPDS